MIQRDPDKPQASNGESREVWPSKSSHATQLTLREEFIASVEGLDTKFIILDRDLRVTYVSKHAEEYLPFEHLGKTFGVDFEVEPAHLAMYRSVFETRETQTVENHRPRDPRMPNLSLRVVPLGEEIVLSFEDVAEKEMRATEIARSEARFRNLAEAMSLAMIVIDTEYRVKYMNPVAALALHIDLTSSIGQSAKTLFPVIMTLIDDKFRTAFETHEGFSLDRFAFQSRIGFMVLRLRAFFVDDELAVLVENKTEQVLAEEKLKASEERFRNLLGDFSIALLLVDEAEKVSYWNRAMEVVSGGIVSANAIGKPVLEMLPFSQTKLSALLNSARSGERDVREVLRVERGNGEGSYDIRGFRIGDEVGLLIEDVSLQVKQALELERTNQNLFDLYNNAPCGYFSVLSKGQIMQMNHRMSEWLGYESPSRFEGLQVTEIFSAASFERFEAELSISGLESPITNLELDFVKRDGDLLRGLVNAMPIFGVEEKQWYWRWTVVDITELRAAQRQVEDSRLFNELFNELGEGVLISDLEGKILRANKAAVRILGIPMEDLTTTRHDSEIWKTVDAEGVPIPIQELPAVTALRERRSITNRELGVMRPDGAIAWILISAAPIFDAEGNISGVILTFPEVTATVTQRQALRDANDLLAVERDKANEANRLKSSFLANMSHEIRTPMTAILGFTDILSGELAGKVSDQHATFLKSISVSGKRLLNLINDILDLSKIEAGRLELQSDDIDVLGELEVAAVPLRFLAQQKGLEIRSTSQIEPGSDRPKIRGDRQRLGQVFTNIISNAIKFTREGRIEIGVSVNGTDEIIVSIKDSGIGISEEFLPHLFEEFRQEHTGITREFGGTGLGLAISSRLVSLMGGRIEVQSQAGIGTTFLLTFPKQASSSGSTKQHQQTPKHEQVLMPTRTVQQQASNATGLRESSSPTVAKSQTGTPQRRVLVVEDNIETQRLLEVYIKQNFLVSRAMNADEALERFKKDLPDAILMDINLPGKDGLWITRQIRTGSLNPETPIVALTAFAMIGDRERCLAAGCNDYLSKPATKREVLEVLEKALAAVPR
jgi:PAS domain S-box-containing protein